MKRIFVLLVVLVPAAVVHAHGYAPSLLEIDQLDTQRVTTRFHPASTLGAATPRVEGCTGEPPSLQCASGELVVVLPTGDGDVLIQLRRVSGEVETKLAPLGARVAFSLRTPAAPVFGAAVRLGATHIASGVDHLLFVAALVALVGFRRQLAWLVSGFTIGHSLTLALGSFGIVVLPPLYVESLIALSLVLVARELLRPDPASLLRRRPLLLAALFGLVHGCGFAAALAELGVDRAARGRVLLGFNVGVEIGQLAFVLLLFVAARLLSRLRPIGRPAIAYAVGVAGVALLCERVAQW